jgi:glycosyltransferase involved in cell wall biosynthesis
MLRKSLKTVAVLFLALCPNVGDFEVIYKLPYSKFNKRNTRTVLIFYPWNMCPPKTGTHHRCLEMIAGFNQLGLNVVLVSSNLGSKWDFSSAQYIKTHGVSKLYVYTPNKLDCWFRQALYSRGFSYFYEQFYLIGRDMVPRMRIWFSRILQQVSPDIVLVNYAQWDWILNHGKCESAVTVVDTHDIFTLNAQLRNCLKQFIPDYAITTQSEIQKEVLEEDFFENLNLKIYAKEFEIYDRYNFAIGISPRETRIIEKQTSKVKTLFIPMTKKPVQLKNSYEGPAVFSAGSHPFNIHGYLFFIKQILPRVKIKAPSFRIQVTGDVANYVPTANGVLLSGYVTNMRNVFAAARFFVCPVLGGTGQQVKIVEAMAHGLPVVAFSKAPGVFPIQNGKNGFLAENENEFVDYVTKLWNSRSLCAEMGQAARKRIASDFSESRLVSSLKLIINGS